MRKPAVVVAHAMPLESGVCPAYGSTMNGDRAERESIRTIVIALAANVGIAFAKLAAAFITSSSGILAEALHAFADSGNEILLLIAQRRSSRQPDRSHPVGHGREAYFWALLASIGVFLTGAIASVGEGIRALFNPGEASNFLVAYAVLFISLALEGLSLVRAYRQLHDEARRLSRNVVEHLLLTSDPTTRAVFAEDAAAVAGNLIALAGVALHQVTGSSKPDAIAAIIIGILVGAVGLILAGRNRDFLVGEQAPAALHERLRDLIAAQPGIDAVTELFVTFVGPRRLSVLARVDINNTLTGADVEQLIRRTERALRKLTPYIARVDVVPYGPASEEDTRRAL